MAVISTYFARLAQFVAIRIIGSGQIALLWPLQTLLIILLSVIFLQERMALIQWLGGGLILVSAGLAVRRGTRRRVSVPVEAIQSNSQGRASPSR